MRTRKRRGKRINQLAAPYFSKSVKQKDKTTIFNPEWHLKSIRIGKQNRKAA
jgi:hypothetical protein